jgi:hypothetical protein
MARVKMEGSVSYDGQLSISVSSKVELFFFYKKVKKIYLEKVKVYWYLHVL